jgi:hypothetical protein
LLIFKKMITLLTILVSSIVMATPNPVTERDGAYIGRSGFRDCLKGGSQFNTTGLDWQARLTLAGPVFQYSFKGTVLNAYSLNSNPTTSVMLCPQGTSVKCTTYVSLYFSPLLGLYINRIFSDYF